MSEDDKPKNDGDALRDPQGGAFFPAPRAKGSYREPAERPLVVVDDAPSLDAPKKIIASRPLPEDEIPDARVAARPMTELREAFRNERSYWDRYTFFTSYPRFCGGVLVLAGGLMSYGTIDTMMNGGTYFRRAALLGPVAFFTGIFPLIFGLPRDEDQRTPDWWRVGYGVSAGIGFIVGIIFLFVLAS